MHDAGKLNEIAEYCLEDVTNTYRLWLRYELFCVAEDFHEARRFSRRLSAWREGKDRFQDTHRLLERALKSWRKGTQQTKDAFAGFFGPKAPVELEAHLDRMINQLNEIIEFGTLQRGNPGQAHKTRRVDMHDFRWPWLIFAGRAPRPRWQ